MKTRLSATLEATHHLRCTLAAERVDAGSGVIYGATVALSDVEAKGKVIMVDAQNRHTWDEDMMTREIPVFTDEKTISTLMAAVAAGGGKFKTREDHDDSIGARAGFADNFKVGAGRVTADIHLFPNYANRAIVLDTIAQTPEEIGLSIDMLPSFEIVGDKAFMRIDKLDAVDIVDEGAITHGGMFLSAGVDTAPKGKPAPGQSTSSPQMTPATNDDLMGAMGTLTKCVTDSMSQLTAALTALSKPPAPVTPPPSEELAALKASTEKINLTLQSVVSENARMKREARLLGFTGNPEVRAKLGAAPDEEAANKILEAEANKKDFLTLSREAKANLKCSAAQAQQHVLKTPEGRDAYRAHLQKRGVAKAA